MNSIVRILFFLLVVTMLTSVTALCQTPVPVSPGWNNIGSPCPFNVTVSSITGPIVGSVFWFNPVAKAYQVVTVMEPGKGYWINASVSGTIIFPC